MRYKVPDMFDFFPANDVGANHVLNDLARAWKNLLVHVTLHERIEHLWISQKVMELFPLLFILVRMHWFDQFIEILEGNHIFLEI